MFQVRVFYPQKELGEYWPCCPQTMTHRSIIHILQQLKDVSSTHSAGLKMHRGTPHASPGMASQYTEVD